MNPSVRKAGLFLVVIMVALLGLTAWWFLPGRRAEVQLPARSPESVPRSALSAEPFFLQTDPRWAADKIGGSGEPLRLVGCTVSCLSMALTHHGILIDPSQLNAKLKEAGGYTGRGWVKWDAIRIVTDGKVQVDLPQNPTHADIDAALTNGDPVLVKVLLSSGIQHWVLLVGREGTEYLMKDPLRPGKTLDYLSSFSSPILAVRFVRKS